MAIVIKNARLVELDPPNVGWGDIRIEGATITDVAPRIDAGPGEHVVDAHGGVVMPGLVNAHTHLYQTLGVGMPLPDAPPRTLLESLEKVWWPYEKAMDSESVTMAGAIGAIEALHCGTTAVIDQLAAPGCIAGSLDQLAFGLARVGIRGVLSYMVTDRHGHDGARAGIDENRRFAESCRSNKSDRFAAMQGAEASFTLSDETLVEMARTPDLPLHIHVGEDLCDDTLSRRRYGVSPIERLDRHGLLEADSIVAHAIHLAPEEYAPLQAATASICYCPRSNMNNGVGHLPVSRVGTPVVLGTDGIGSNMLIEARMAWLRARDVHEQLSPREILAMLATSQRIAGRLLGVRMGELKPGAAADLVVTAYRPATPMRKTNLADHVVFRLATHHVRHVMVAGEWVLFDRRTKTIDERTVRRDSERIAHLLWKRLGEAD
jgi:putative selenium metabolism protein SsnA